MATTNIRNAEILCEFVMSEYREQNLKLSSRQSHIKITCLFDRFLNHKDDILDYVSSLKKSAIRPVHPSDVCLSNSRSRTSDQ